MTMKYPTQLRCLCQAGRSLRGFLDASPPQSFHRSKKNFSSEVPLPDAAGKPTEYIRLPNHTIFAEKILEKFVDVRKGTVVDFTFGEGRHTKLLLENFPEIKVIAVDRDKSVWPIVRDMKKQYPHRLCFLDIKFR